MMRVAGAVVPAVAVAGAVVLAVAVATRGSSTVASQCLFSLRSARRVVVVWCGMAAVCCLGAGCVTVT